MAAAASDEPVLCIIDDAQWLDQVSVQTLAFVARRLMAEPVALVFAVRDQPDVLAGLPELGSRALSDSDARELLESVMVGGIDPRVRDRIVAETRGIPLALLEVPRSVSATELAGGFWISGKRSSTAAIEDGFVAASSASGADATTVARRGGRAGRRRGPVPSCGGAAGHSVDALAPAEAAGVIEFGPRMRFHHPLVRSAAYRAADLTDRRADASGIGRSHRPGVRSRPSGMACGQRRDGSRRCGRRRAGGVGGPGPEQGRCRRGGGIPRARDRADVRPGTARFPGARRGTGETRRGRARGGVRTPRDRRIGAVVRAAAGPGRPDARSDGVRPQPWRRCRAHSGRARPPRNCSTPQGDSKLSTTTWPGRRTSRRSPLRCTRAGSASPAIWPSRRRRPRSGQSSAELRRPIDFLLSGMASRIIDGPGPVPTICAPHWSSGTTTRSRATANAVMWPFPIAQESAAHELWDDAVLQQIATDTVRRARDTGALAVLPPALTYRAGVMSTAANSPRRQGSSKRPTQSPRRRATRRVKYHSLNLAAWRGIPGDAVDLIEAAAADGTARGKADWSGSASSPPPSCSTASVDTKRPSQPRVSAVSTRTSAFHSWCLFELIEAAAHLGDHESAAAALPRFAERAGASGTRLGVGCGGGARALLADDENADGLFVEAVERLERATSCCTWPAPGCPTANGCDG